MRTMGEWDNGVRANLAWLVAAGAAAGLVALAIAWGDVLGLSPGALVAVLGVAAVLYWVLAK